MFLPLQSSQAGCLICKHAVDWRVLSSYTLCIAPSLKKDTTLKSHSMENSVPCPCIKYKLRYRIFSPLALQISEQQSETKTVIPVSSGCKAFSVELLKKVIGVRGSVFLAWVAHDGAFTVYKVLSGIEQPEEKLKLDSH